MNTNPTIAIVGATGAVGREMMLVLEQRRFPCRALRLFASAKSAGQSLTFRNEPVQIEELRAGALKGIDLALFSAGASISRTFAPAAVQSGTIVVDNSSAFRGDATRPLVIPEINPHTLPAARPAPPVLVAVPNCSTIIMLVAANPLRQRFGIARMVVSTYQAASGAGASAMAELEEQTRDVLAGREAVPRIFPEPYAFNLFSHNAPMDPVSGLNGEESKMISETRRIWEDPEILLSPTCIRVPVLRAHSQSINITLRRPASEREVRAALLEAGPAAGVVVIDDRAGNRFPTPQKASGGDAVLVGRIRADPSCVRAGWTADTPVERVDLFVSGDQLRKGAALNAVQIAELLR
ncbi:MAG: aspartate-semialdehyde dehydrogenase [Phycisphaerales bacterium]